MSSVVGPVKVVRVGPGSLVNVGDIYSLSPSDTSKSNAGAGALNTGDSISVSSRSSSTNHYDPDLGDQPKFKA
ncbi:spore germination protein [Virgibacillus proomii]|jgi:spore germination protein PF|uniref:spore germination protein n=1 Tax=Virgibacillus proomii TaxID=84407 RepID=UPI000984E5D9|nr:spore germination protein [Virgibacillus proomii]